ncbi:carbon-nitrogen hydrolase family protein [Ferrimonas gelatinilytica]|uniref:Carbon-nitrogen hydrolase family protein n=1 Tax=Ferrimonas gelatinilytica TaxID=1255257 RepID=A0ABP9SFZ9_9GAMM
MECHLLQMNSQGSPERDLAWVRSQLASLARTPDPRLVILPEACLHMAAGPWNRFAEPDEGPNQQALAQMAREFDLYLLAGTLPITAGDGRAYASSCLYGPDGTRLGRYDKIHMFDAKVGDGKSYHESAHTCPGDGVRVVDTPFGRLGWAVCYDLRFPELFTALVELGAEIIALPSAFTYNTGQAHWEVLVRARAIESQCYLLAANQCGVHRDGRRTWGHSLVVDPWGRVIADGGEEPGRISVKLDPELITQARDAIPVQQHRRHAGGGDNDENEIL